MLACQLEKTSKKVHMKVISLNIEAHKHLDKVIPFLKKEQPDVVNLQEVFKVDAPVLAQALEKDFQFLPMTNVTSSNMHNPDPLGEIGNVQLFPAGKATTYSRYYVGHGEKYLPIFFKDANPNSTWRGVSWIKIVEAGVTYTLATTHFTWSPKGETTELQLEHFKALSKILDIIGDCILTGDFNAPRGREIFTSLSTRYKDNIPTEVTTTIDGQFHKAGNLEYVVDGFFSTPKYLVRNVQVVGGVSDHKAIITEVTAQ